MEHTPFEEWLLSEEERSAEERQALQDHLNICARCSTLADSWHAVRDEFEQAPFVSPAPGFTRRFQVRLAQRQAAIQRRNAWIIFAVLALVGISLGTFLVYRQLGGFPSWMDLLVSLAQSVAFNLRTIDDAGQFIIALGRTLPLPVAIGLWATFMTSLAFWILIWFVMIWRLPHRERNIHEI